MSWLYVKQKDTKHLHYITEEAYEATFKKLGFEIVSNAENGEVVAQTKCGNDNVQPNNPNSEKAVKNEQSNRKAKVKNTN